MIKLNLPREPHWITLAAGVRLQVRPATTALVMAARDAVLFMLSWELMSLAPFFLIDFNDGDRKVRDASWVYLVAAHLGAVALMAFFVLLWQRTGTTSFDALPGGGVMPGAVLISSSTKLPSSRSITSIRLQASAPTAKAAFSTTALIFSVTFSGTSAGHT